jgi:hypothetical protein
MSSSPHRSCHFSDFNNQHQQNYAHSHLPIPPSIPTPHHYPQSYPASDVFDNPAYVQALAFFQGQQQQHQHSQLLPTDASSNQHAWSMYQGDQSHSRHSAPPPQGLDRARPHERTPSASTVASTAPTSPFPYNNSFPRIVHPECTPNSPAANSWDFSGSQADQSLYSFSKHPLSQTDSFFLSAPGYVPSRSPHTSAAHLAMKGFAIDHHNLEDLPLELAHTSHQSMSSAGQDSPATPRSTAEDTENKLAKTISNGEIATKSGEQWDDYLLFGNVEYRQSRPNVQLHRTESAAYQDELYNPANFTAAPAQAPPAATKFLTPHRNLINERLQTANIARSVSPSSASRERSPFRHGSPLAPAQDAWNSPRMGTQAGMRQQQKEETAQAEMAQHRSQLHREPTKTISPKDALLDYTDTDQPPLFQDTIPTGYKQHFGGTEQFPANFFSQGNASFMGDLPTSQPNMTSFRATNSADALSGITGGNLNLSPSVQGQAQIQQAPSPFQAGHYQQASNSNNNMNTSYPTTSVPEPTPDFPAHLTSMESSMSDNPGPSSQEGNGFLNIQRPDDTRANTGTYTCTYHGCTQRFESQPALQRHKRDFHRSQAHNNRDSGAESGAASVSPSSTGARSTESPAPSDDVDESGMTSAALLARNSQAGPHKCSRINPSTGKPCNTVFSRPYDLTRHEDTIHNNRKKKVQCPHCREEKTFSRNDALTRHMRVVHPEADLYGKRGRD